MIRMLIMTCSFLAFCLPVLSAERIPVIFDTDIGDDIDDTWALAMLLKSPHFDVQLITTTRGKAEYRAKIIARLLTIAGRTDIPIGLGAGGRAGDGPQQGWVANYKLSQFSGKIYDDGVAALVEKIASAPKPLTVIAVGPLETLSEALKRKPGIAAQASLVGMHGSVRRGYDGGQVSAEYNVKANVPAAQRVFTAPWRQITITPLDTCGLVTLSGKRFRTLRDCRDSVVGALLDNYRIWSRKDRLDQLQASSVLFDTVAIYLAKAADRSLLKMETLPIAVTSDGFTRIDPKGKTMAVATDWKDLNAYRDLLVKVLRESQ
jgi:inosine-uridine nucleoside N-ribohydrolase